MILIVAEAVVKKDCVEQFLKAAEPCIASTRKEADNISYDLLVDPGNPCKFTFLEQWANREALTPHGRSEHFKTFSAAIRNLMETKFVINVYDAQKL